VDKCVAGAFCKFGNSDTGICATQLTTAGVSCEGADECAPPLLCFTLAGPDDGKCYRVGKTGDDCSPGSSNLCPYPNVVCDPISQICVRAGRLGDACSPDPNDAVSNCVEYAECDPETKKCTLPSNQCNPVSGCDFGGTCNPTTMTCEYKVINQCPSQ
jgi:hypothetical protein